MTVQVSHPDISRSHAIEDISESNMKEHKINDPLERSIFLLSHCSQDKVRSEEFQMFVGF